ncbi:MAG: Mur ligase family protein [Phycisphaeraceae bacterium]
MDVRGRRVVLMGLGRFGGGVGAARFLAQRGARLLVTDLVDEASLRASLDQLADLPDIEYRLGEHREADFTSADLVVANPAVRPGNRYIEAARSAGVAITSEIRLLVQYLPTRTLTIGVTGTAGKSTTTAMIAHALRHLAHGPYEATALRAEPRAADAPQPQTTPRTWLGGNLGGSLLPELDRIDPDDWIVLELSSFMLEGLREQHWSPHIAVLTNFQPNHLDWHGSVDAYRAAKQAIFDFQRDGDIAIAGPGVPEQFTPRVTDMRSINPSNADKLDLLLPGEHNQLNARLAATALEAALNIPVQQITEALRDFAGLPHRLQLVAEHAGVRYYNDSKSTTPEAARLAIDSFPPNTAHLILGGSDKGSDLTSLAQRAAQRCRAVYTLGDTGDTIASAAEQAPQRRAEIVRCGDLDTAMQQIAPRVRRGDAVVLSPGCASYDQFDHFEHRGARFTEAVLRYTTETGMAPKTETS